MDAAAIGKKLKQLYPQYQAVDDAVLGQKYMQKYGGAVSSVQSGQIGIKDIPEAQRVGVSVGLDAVGYKSPESAAEGKKKDSINAVTNLINNLEKHYQEAGGGEVNVPILSRILGVGKDIQGSLGFNDAASTYNKEREGFAATLKSLTGDTGVLTDQDFARLSKLLPGLGAKPQEAKNLLNDLRSQIAAKYGGEATQTTIKPDEKGLIDVLLGNAKNTFQDIRAGAIAANPRIQESREQGFKQAQQLEQMAQAEKDPTRKKALLQEAAKLYAGIGDEAQMTAQSFSEDVKDDPVLRGVGAGSEIATLAEAPAILKSVFNVVKNPKVLSPKEALGKVFTQDKGKALRNEVVDEATKKGAKIDGNKIFNSIDEWAAEAKKANPQAIKSIDNFVSGAKEQFKGKKLNPDEVFKLWDNASKGFTAAGTKGSSMVASYHRAVRDTVRGLLDDVAPGFEEGTQLIRKGLQRSDTVSKVGKIALGSGVGLLSTTALLKLLGMLGVDNRN